MRILTCILQLLDMRIPVWVERWVSEVHRIEIILCCLSWNNLLWLEWRLRSLKTDCLSVGWDYVAAAGFISSYKTSDRLFVRKIV